MLLPDQISPQLHGGVVYRDGAVVYILDGEIDIANARLLFQRLLDLGVSRQGDLVLDMDAITFIDSSGLWALLGVREELAALDRRLLIRRTSAAVEQVLELLDISWMFGASEDEAA